MLSFNFNFSFWKSNVMQVMQKKNNNNKEGSLIYLIWKKTSHFIFYILTCFICGQGSKIGKWSLMPVLMIPDWVLFSKTILVKMWSIALTLALVKYKRKAA